MELLNCNIEKLRKFKKRDDVSALVVYNDAISRLLYDVFRKHGTIRKDVTFEEFIIKFYGEED